MNTYKIRTHHLDLKTIPWPSYVGTVEHDHRIATVYVHVTDANKRHFEDWMSNFLAKQDFTGDSDAQ